MRHIYSHLKTPLSNQLRILRPTENATSCAITPLRTCYDIIQYRIGWPSSKSFIELVHSCLKCRHPIILRKLKIIDIHRCEMTAEYAILQQRWTFHPKRYRLLLPKRSRASRPHFFLSTIRKNTASSDLFLQRDRRHVIFTQAACTRRPNESSFD